MSQPTAIWEGFKNKDYSVSAATSVSLIIRIIITISTALISLSPTRVFRTDIPITLKSEFIDDAAGPEKYSELALHTLLGMIEFNGTIPDGISEQYAYQLFETHLPPSTTLTTTVNGLSLDLNCQPANAFFPSTFNDTSPVKLISDECNFTITVGNDGDLYADVAGYFRPYPLRAESYTNVSRYIGTVASVGCNGSLDRQDQRMGILFALANCESFYWLHENF